MGKTCPSSAFFEIVLESGLYRTEKGTELLRGMTKLCVLLLALTTVTDLMARTWSTVPVDKDNLLSPLDVTCTVTGSVDEYADEMSKRDSSVRLDVGCNVLLPNLKVLVMPVERPPNSLALKGLPSGKVQHDWGLSKLARLSKFERKDCAKGFAKTGGFDLIAPIGTSLRGSVLFPPSAGSTHVDVAFVFFGGSDVVLVEPEAGASRRNTGVAMSEIEYEDLRGSIEMLQRSNRTYGFAILCTKAENDMEK